jgi:hypothetical protein
LTPVTTCLILIIMVLPQTERTLIQLLDYFDQLTTSQLRRLVFFDSRSRTTCDRVLKRMLTDGYVAQIERHRPQGGKRGGSGEYVWRLGKEGWRLCGYEKRWPTEKRVDYHSLTVGSIYVKLREDERLGKYKLTGFTPEPESWKTIQGIELKADLLIELERPGAATMTAYIEMDMGTQRPARITEKLDRYQRAYAVATDEDLAELPRVVFVAHSPERRDELDWIIKRFGNEHRYFYTATADEFPDDMH